MPSQLALPDVPRKTQRALILRGPKQRYELVDDWPLPLIESPNEVLIRIEAIGLNPIDWKSVDFGFAIPTLPAVNGRDLAGVIVDVGPAVKRLKKGDRVFGPSTQYRDYRTSAFQSYAVTLDHCLGVIPPTLTFEQASAISVGVVTAALALGSSFGIKIHGFSPRELAIGADGENKEWMRKSPRRHGSNPDAAMSAISVASSTLEMAPVCQRHHQGEWLLIWGASSVTGSFAAQFARAAGMRVIAVADHNRHGQRLMTIGVERIIDRASPEAAVAEIRRLTNGSLRYAIDCVGKATAKYAIESLDATRQTYIVGLTGLPQEVPGNVQLCSVPIKTFHSNPSVGAGLMRVIEELLIEKKLVLPDVEVHSGGLGAINDALDRLRRGELSGGRLVIRTFGDNDADRSVCQL